jgi:hypothetical protein
MNGKRSPVRRATIMPAGVVPMLFPWNLGTPMSNLQDACQTNQ